MKKRKLLFALTLALALPAHAQTFPYQDPSLSSLVRARDLCSRLTLEEKSKLMRNGSPAIPRLGIPQFEWWSEGLHGIARNGYATVFPENTGMAASFDDALLYQVFSVVSDEAVAKANLARRSGTIGRYQGVSIWTPNINIFRDPRWGRGMETYGEDPYLTSRMGIAVVDGLQGQPWQKDMKPLAQKPHYYKTLSCAKHFAIHSGPEWNRHVFNIENLPERDLWETYLPAFKALTTIGNVREVMCAYQRFDDQPCCGNTRLLGQILRDEWKYDGLVVSDCGAISDFFKEGHHHVVNTPQEATAQAVGAGTDVECGSTYGSLPDAVRKGLVSMAKVDTSVVRLLKARFEVGDFDDEKCVPWKRTGNEVIATPQHHALALKMARESMTLLQNNNNILPLKKNANIVVMGPNANDSVMLWGNYYGYPTKTTTILKGIRSKAASHVTYIDGCGYTHNEKATSLFDELMTPDGHKGMQATYWNNKTMNGTPVAKAVMTMPINQSNGGNTVFAPGVALEDFSATYEGVFSPKKNEDLNVNLRSDDYGRVIINNDTVINNWRSRRISVANKTYRFEAGKTYRIRVEYAQEKDYAVCQFDLLDKRPATADQLVAEAKNADVVVFVGGISPRLEGEEMKVNEPGFKGGDRTSIELPEAQREIISKLRAAGKKIVFVNCSGGAVALEPESNNCEAILQAWYGGESGGQAVADVLFGDYNPSGKLPVTFYRHDSDLPDFLEYKMTNRTYRYFKGDALFPFGYGLSYTTFAFGKPEYKNGKVYVNVTNKGKRDGAEVVQVYVKDPRDTNGPIKTLRGFQRVSLKAGEHKTVAISMPRERFALWDTESNTMRVKGGEYILFVGNSSRAEDLKEIRIKL